MPSYSFKIEVQKHCSTDHLMRLIWASCPNERRIDETRQRIPSVVASASWKTLPPKPRLVPFSILLPVKHFFFSTYAQLPILLFVCHGPETPRIASGVERKQNLPLPPLLDPFSLVVLCAATSVNYVGLLFWGVFFKLLPLNSSLSWGNYFDFVSRDFSGSVQLLKTSQKPRQVNNFY